MWPIATDVASSMVAVLGTRASCATPKKQVNQSRCRLGAELAWVQRNHVLHGGLYWTSPLALSNLNRMDLILLANEEWVLCSV